MAEGTRALESTEPAGGGAAGAPDAAVEGILAAFLRGETSAEVAFAQMACCAARPADVRGAMERRALEAEAAGDPRAPRLRELARAAAEARDGFTALVERLRAGGPAPSGGAATSADGALAEIERLFDWSARRSEEASVALYSLGSPEILRRATAEVVGFLDRRALLGPDRRVLQIGCGIGRFEEALSPRVAEAHGVDISAAMVAAARRRCAGLPNVRVERTDGRSLALFPDAVFDLVYAVDSFPYLVQAGDALVDAHFRESARVLRAGGHLLILNHSYRADPARDREDVRRLGVAHGLDLLVDGERPFRLWDGLAWLLRLG